MGVGNQDPVWWELRDQAGEQADGGQAEEEETEEEHLIVNIEY